MLYRPNSLSSYATFPHTINFNITIIIIITIIKQVWVQPPRLAVNIILPAFVAGWLPVAPATWHLCYNHLTTGHSTANLPAAVDAFDGWIRQTEHSRLLHRPSSTCYAGSSNKY